MQAFIINSNEIKSRIDPLYYSQAAFDTIKQLRCETKKLSELVLYFKTGFAAGKQDQDETQKGIIQIRPTNIDSGGNLIFDKNVYISEQSKKVTTNLLQKGEILFNNTNSQELVGKTAYFDLDDKYLCSNHITRIGVDESVILPKYLQIILNLYQRKKVFFNICTNWNNQSGINVNLLKTLDIPVPEISIQEEVILLLDTANQKKQQKEKEAQKLLDSIDTYILNELDIQIPEIKKSMIFIVDSKKLKNNRFDPSYFQPHFKVLEEIFSNTKNSTGVLKDLSNKITSGSTPLSGSEAYSDRANGIAFIRSGEINPENKINFDSTLYIKSEIHNKKLKGSQLKRGDLLIAIVGATIGQVSIYDYDNEANINQAIALVRLKDQVNPLYVKEFLYSKIGQIQLNQIKRPVARANINLDEIGKLKIIYPSKDVQDKMVEQTNSIRVNVEKLQQEAIEGLEKAKKQAEEILLATN